MATVSVTTRRQVAELARGRCDYCRLPESYAPSPFTVDHILPRSREGNDDLQNLALACHGCNGAKYNKIETIDPATGATVPLFHPRQQRCIGALHLNREGAVNLRDVLMLRGVHPPDED